MKSEQFEQSYARFSASPDRIDGAVQNTVSARLGVAFNYSAMDQMDAVEIAFNNEPIGTTRYMMVVDMAAARLGIDPVAIRRKNLIRDDAHPSTGPSGIKFEALSHHACLDNIKEGGR